jgi:formylglycine-generating enzyme required for sulfatase activity
MANISWDEAEAFCQWAGGRLPTEAEWEYAARAGSPAAFYGKPDDISWNSGQDGHRDETVHPVGQKAPNALGLYDMLGNLREWCRDFYGPYTPGAVTDPAGPVSGDQHVMRGGAFNDRHRALRVSFRFRAHDRDSDFGFRCALPAP